MCLHERERQTQTLPKKEKKARGSQKHIEKERFQDYKKTEKEPDV